MIVNFLEKLKIKKFVIKIATGREIYLIAQNFRQFQKNQIFVLKFALRILLSMKMRA